MLRRMYGGPQWRKFLTLTGNDGSHCGLIDSHHHLWDVGKFEYSWMPRDNSILRRNYLPDDLEPNIINSGVGSTIVVQATHNILESKFLLYLASQTEWIAGVVAWVDLHLEDVEKVIEELMALGPLVGIRHQVEDDPDDDWLVSDLSIRGLTVVANQNLAYDVLIKPRHLKHIPVVADRVPNLRMVIDHIAKPFIGQAIMEPWATDMMDAAEASGAFCKVSGMVTQASKDKWAAADFRPYVKCVREIYGVDRLMWGSDWPVCLLAADYNTVLDIALDAMGSMSDKDRHRFLSGSASEFYRISK